MTVSKGAYEKGHDAIRYAYCKRALIALENARMALYRCLDSLHWGHYTDFQMAETAERSLSRVTNCLHLLTGPIHLPIDEDDPLLEVAQQGVADD